MMAASSHVKLGLLTVMTVVALAVIAYMLAIRRIPTDTYHTYFDESVQGLDRGAMVKFRGVRIGKVSRISIAPDHQLIDVEMAIDKGAVDLHDIGPRLRTQLVSYGITGVKLIDLDLATPDTPPPPRLVFIAPKNYVASRPSLFDSLTRRLDTLSARLIALVDRVMATVDQVHELVDTGRQLMATGKDLMGKAGGAAGDFRSLVRHIDDTTGKLDHLIDSAHSASNSSRELVRTVSESSADLAQTLHDVRGAARSIGMFFDALEREPDMLVKGRTGSHR